MRMTVLRALRSKEMDVDLEHKTHTPCIEPDELGNVTIYGEETREGELYYVVLDKDVCDFVESIRHIKYPTLILKPTEMFALGRSYGSFRAGDINGGIEAVLPTRNLDIGVWTNIVFQELVDEYFYNIDYPPGYEDEYPYQWPHNVLCEKYMNAIKEWAADHNVTLWSEDINIDPNRQERING